MPCARLSLLPVVLFKVRRCCRGRPLTESALDKFSRCPERAVFYILSSHRRREESHIFNRTWPDEKELVEIIAAKRQACGKTLLAMRFGLI